MKIMPVSGVNNRRLMQYGNESNARSMLSQKKKAYEKDKESFKSILIKCTKS